MAVWTKIEELGDRLKAFPTFAVREDDVVVTSPDEWKKVEDRFLEGARTTAIMSLDTESLRGPEAARQKRRTGLDYEEQGMGVVWVISTTGLGLTVRFDIRRLRQSLFPETGRHGRHFLSVLPRQFVFL